MGAASQTASASIKPVGVQFFAEVPLQQSAEEIVNVSRRASNCIDATMSPDSNGIGVFEQLIIGPFSPLDLKGVNDAQPD